MVPNWFRHFSTNQCDIWHRHPLFHSHACRNKSHMAVMGDSIPLPGIHCDLIVGESSPNRSTIVLWTSSFWWMAMRNACALEINLGNAEPGLVVWNLTLEVAGPRKVLRWDLTSSISRFLGARLTTFTPFFPYAVVLSAKKIVSRSHPIHRLARWWPYQYHPNASRSP